MKSVNTDLLPPALLAIAYAPREIRPAFTLLLQFDARFASIVGNAGEPLIGQMKLAWWRDALNATASARPKGEPLLSALYDFDNPILTDAAIRLVDSWELLIANTDWPVSVLERFAELRGQAVFAGYTQLCDAPEFPASLATLWATDDLRTRFGDRVNIAAPAMSKLPTMRSLRPLSILAMSVRGVSGPHIIWHALTGR